MTTIESIEGYPSMSSAGLEIDLKSREAQLRQATINRRRQEMSRLTSHLENGLPYHQKLVALTDPHVTGSLTDNEPGRGTDIYRLNDDGAFEYSANVRTVGRALLFLGDDLLMGDNGPIVVNHGEGIGITPWGTPKIVDLEQRYSQAWRILGSSIAGSEMQKSAASLQLLSEIKPGTTETLVFPTP